MGLGPNGATGNNTRTEDLHVLGNAYYSSFFFFFLLGRLTDKKKKKKDKNNKLTFVFTKIEMKMGKYKK